MGTVYQSTAGVPNPPGGTTTLLRNNGTYGVSQFTVAQDCTITNIFFMGQDASSNGVNITVALDVGGTINTIASSYNFGGDATPVWYQLSFGTSIFVPSGTLCTVRVTVNTTALDSMLIGYGGSVSPAGNGISAWSGSPFEVGITWQPIVPSTPAITAPATNSNFPAGTAVTLSWSASTPGKSGDTINYTAWVSTDQGKTYNTIAQNITATSTTYTIPSNATSGSEYMFYVTANESNANASSTTVYIFANPSGTISRISTVVGSAYDTSGNGGRKLVELSNGWIVAAAISANGSSVYFEVSKDNALTWSPLCNTSAGQSTGSYAIASSGTTVYYLGTYSADASLDFIRFDATTVSNVTLGDTTHVDASQNSFGSGVSLCIDGTGVLKASWSSKNPSYPNSFNLRYSQSTDNGTTWSTPTQVTTSYSAGYDFTNSCIVVRSNNYPTIISQYVYSGGCAIVAYVWGGSAWSSIRTVYDGSTYSQVNPSADVDSNDKICVSWYGADATYSAAQIKYSEATDGGNTWSAMLNLTTASYQQAMPSVTVDKNNNVFVLFEGYDSAISTSYRQVRRIEKTGGTWGSVASLTNNTAGDAAYPATLGSKSANFTDPLTIYMDAQTGTVKFRGTQVTSQPPNIPSFSNISSNGSTINTKPKMFSLVSDPNSGGTITNVEVQISTVSTFATTVIDSQYGSDSGYGTQQAAAFSGLPTASNATSTVTFTPQTALAAGTLYVRVRSKDSNAAWSSWSATQTFTVAAAPWTDAPAAGNPGMKAQWFDDLAAVINNARQFRGLTTFTFTDGTVSAQDTNGNGVDIKAAHVMERRQKLTDILTVVGTTWSPPPVDTTSDRDGQHIIDLRSYAAKT